MKAMVSGLLPPRKIACRLGLGASFFWRKFFLEPKELFIVISATGFCFLKSFVSAYLRGALMEMVAYF